MADETDLSLLSSKLSLTEICEKQSISQISDPNFTASDFAALEPRLQEILFNKLRTENTRLQEIEKKWCQVTDSCPHVDIQIHLNPPRIAACDGKEMEDAYDEAAAFMKKWSYLGEDYDEDESVSQGVEANEDHPSGGTKMTRDTRWWNSNLICKGPESDFELCGHTYARCSCSPWTNSFTFRISSQLLFYRLTVTFGMPPPRETDGYKTCWEITLRHSDKISVLNFQDTKGAADVRFDGTADASADALKLVNFLIGIKCPHTYDGVVAGVMA